jgi:predicted anti-sigma-YlaC factor YlaD
MVSRNQECLEREAEAVRAARQAGAPDAALAAHLRTCAACREAFDVARYMTRLAAEADAIAATRPLPEASQLWWKARLLKRWDVEARATAPLDWMQRIEVAGGVIAVIVLLVMFWTDMRGDVAANNSMSVANRFWPAIASLLAPGALSSMIAAALVLIGCLSLFTLRQLLTEE